MARILTKLRIDEVSAVDRGAGDGVKIVLMKRASEPGATPADTLRAFPNPTSFNAVLSLMEAEELAKADHGDHDAGDRHDRVPVVDHHASTIANLLVEAGSFPHHAAALHHVLHSATGQALLARMRKAAEIAKDTTMSTESLEGILKDFGPVRLCKTIVERQRSPVGEHELVMSLSQHVGGDVAFSKLYASEESVRRACAIAKEAMPFMPTMVGGVAPTHEAIDNTEQSEAYAQLVRMAEKMRAASPELSAAQAFERVFSDKRNASLAAKAHVRPSPTTFFPMPR
jgi:hypothetical protein